MKKSFGAKFTRFTLRPLSLGLAKSPRWVRNLLAGVLTVLWWDLFRIRRKVVLKNLERAFPEKSSGERRHIGRQSIFHMALNLTEFSVFPFFNENWLSHWIEFKGLEYLDQAHAEKKGVLVLSLHLGNGDLGMAGLAHRGYPMHLISKRFKAKWLDELWFGLRARHGTRFIEPEKSSFEILKTLKKNQRVVFVLDQFMGPPVGVKTRFFGHETGTAFGLALIAERVGCPVIPGYSYRGEGGMLTVEFGPPVPLVPGTDRSQTHSNTTQSYTNEIESIIRAHPEQWMWLHKRWKPFVE